MLRYLTAGESHGPELTAILEGMPSNVPISLDAVNHQLWRRQQGYGRGGRMRIETDQVTVTSGIRFGKTLGTPITLHVENRDWKNWTNRMSVDGQPPEDLAVITKPRPGHADLAGALKYDHQDIRNVLERSSARNTATLVAVGAIAREFLKNFGISVMSHVTEIGGIRSNYSGLTCDEINHRAEASQVRVADASAENEIIELIQKTRKDGNTLGGVFEVIITGVPVGLGSFSMPDRKLDARLAGALMGIQAIKGVEIGLGFEAARKLGSDVHDEIFYDEQRGYYRNTNGAGGMEAGISNGMPIVVRAAMKPIPTLYKPLKSVDMVTKQAFEAVVERSDVCAVPAAAVVGENVAAYVVADLFLDKFGGDSLQEVERNFQTYLEQVRQR